MRIAITTDGIFPLSIGGMQRHSKLLIEGLSAQLNENIELHVIHPHDVQLFSNHINVYEHKITEYRRHKFYLFDCFCYSQAVSKVLELIKPDVIYAQGLTVWSNLSKWGAITIVNPHGLEAFQAFSFRDKLIAIPFKLIFKYIFRKSARVVSLGGKLTTILSNIVPQEQIVMLPNGIDLSHFPMRKEEPTEFKFLFLGRFASNKGIDLLLATCCELANEGYKFKVDLIGKGPLFECLEKEYNSKTWVTFHGFLSDEEIAVSYRMCSVFILPTLFEGMPTVVLEAMASGAPIIVSNVGACSELVQERNGWLIPAGDKLSLRRAMIEALSDDNLSFKGKNSNLMAERFQWNEIVESTLNAMFEVSKAHIIDIKF